MNHSAPLNHSEDRIGATRHENPPSIAFSPQSAATLATPPRGRWAVRAWRASLVFGLAALLSSCTSAPLISRKGVSELAVAELVYPPLLVPAVLALAYGGGGADFQNFGGFKLTDERYLVGIVPFDIRSLERDTAADNGNRLSVNGRRRSFIPGVVKLRGSGPHVARIEVPSFQPFDLPLTHTVSVRLGEMQVNTWPPVIVDCLTGEIFTTLDLQTLDVDRNSGRVGKTDLRKEVSGPPVLIVATTEERHPSWKKIGQMQTAWSVGAL